MKREKKGSRRAYSPEFKEEALRLVASGSASIAAIARELGVRVETLRLWRRAAAAQGKEPAEAAGLEEENRRLRRENARLREEREIVRKSDGVLRADRAVKYARIERLRPEHAVRRVCAVLDVWPSGYYAWRRRAPSARALQDAVLTAQVWAVHRRTRRRYGSPRIHLELQDVQTSADPATATTQGGPLQVHPGSPYPWW